MTIKYRDLLAEYKLTLDSDVLDPAFVSKAKDFEAKIEAGSLTDQEIESADNELVELFKSLHNLDEEDSDEVKKANHKADLAGAKADIQAAETLEELEKLKAGFAESIPEVIPIIDKKIAKFKEAAQKKADDDAEKEKERFIKEGKELIKNALETELPALAEKYKDYPELAAMVNKRIADNQEPSNKEKKMAETLRSKKEWHYSELREIGIQPTGNDMVVAGVKLEKEYLLTVYSVRR